MTGSSPDLAGMSDRWRTAGGAQGGGELKPGEKRTRKNQKDEKQKFKYSTCEVHSEESNPRTGQKLKL